MNARLRELSLAYFQLRIQIQYLPVMRGGQQEFMSKLRRPFRLVGDQHSQVEDLRIQVARMAIERGGENRVRLFGSAEQHENDGQFVSKGERIGRGFQPFTKYLGCFI